MDYLFYPNLGQIEGLFSSVHNEGHVSHEQNTMCLIGYGGLL